MATDYKPEYSPRYEITVGGTTYAHAGASVTGLVVESTQDGADRFSFTLNQEFSPEQGEFTDLTLEDFEVGTEVAVSMGWGDGELKELMRGTVNSVTAEFSMDGGPTVSVSGYGVLHRIMRGVHSRSWNEVTVADVAESVLSDAGLSATVQASGPKHDQIVQHEESDYRFLRRLADQYGHRLYAVGEDVFFEDRSAGDSGDPVAELRYGEALTSFTGEINSGTEVDEVEVRYWDEKSKKVTTASATASDRGTGEKEVFRATCWSSEEAKRIAERRLGRYASAIASGRGEADGVPELLAGTVVELTGLGSRFSGKYYITKATHRMGGSGYRTSFEATEIQ